MKICLECEGITDAPQDRCASCGARMVDTRAVHFPLRRGEEDAGNPLLGTVVDGKYLVQGVLGKGGMGTVFRAIHQVSLVPVALKILNPRFSARGEYRDYFLAEAQKAGRVIHEHAGRILDVGEAEDGTVYIAMEEVTGVTLYDCMHGEVPLAPAVVVDILAQICRALAAAHEAGLVHRDLTPRNVMVVIRAGEPFIKILDFGIAKGLPHPADPDRDPGLQRAPSGFANPPYSAPEHLEGKEVDARGDLYSLGVIAWEALTQSSPVAPGSTDEVAAATLRGQFLPWPAPAGVPATLLRLIRRLLERDPERRPGSALEVLDTLERIRQPGSRALRDVALLLFFVAVVVLWFAHYDPGEPFLQLRSGGLRLEPPSATLQRPEPMQSAGLARLTFEFTGFAATDLHVEVSQIGEQPYQVGLQGVTQADGTLLLDASRSGSYRTLLESLGRSGRSADLTFLVPGQRALGRARVWIDDVPPALGLQHSHGPGVAINADSRLQVGCTETSALSSLVLECRVGEKSEVLVARRDLLDPPRDLEVGISCIELLGACQPGVVALRDVHLTLIGEDRAGNVATPAHLRFKAMDFRVPGILTPDPAQALFDDASARDAATLLLKLDAEEPDLAVFLALGDGQFTPLQVVQSVGDQLTLRLTETAAIGLPDATYQIKIEDQAGNHAGVTRRIVFSVPGASFALAARGGVAGVLQPLANGNELLWSGADVSFEFGCSPLYRPTSVQLRSGGALIPGLAELEHGEPGAGRLRLRSGGAAGPKDGRLELELTLGSAHPGVDELVQRISLRLLRRPLRLRLPDTSGVRFYGDLLRVGGGLFSESQPGHARHPCLVPTDAEWVLDPPDARLLRGEVYWLSPSPAVLDRVALPPIASPEAMFIPPRRREKLHLGRNRACLGLTDLLGRPVEVSLGDRSAPELQLAGLPRRVVQVLEFQFQAEEIRTPAAPLILENLQDPRVVVETGYTLSSDDFPAIRLSLVGARGVHAPCSRLQTLPGGGTRLEFDLPFHKVAGLVAGRETEASELRRGGYEFSLDLRLDTPAFDKSFVRSGKSIRSSLRELRLGPGFGIAIPALAEVRMVPVLPDLDVEFRDRVGERVRRDGGFLRRQPIDVSGVGDFYLQSRALTRGQYAAIVDRFVGLPADQRSPPVRIHHPGDPAGAVRLTRRGMVPFLYRERAVDWQRAVDRTGDAPVTGASFYQAYAIARMAGQLLFADPTVLRLPFGVELELAALGSCPANVLHGVPGEPPLAQVRQQGDAVSTAQGVLHGLDFGVREWVQDIPWPADAALRPLVAGAMRNHRSHLAQAVLGPTGLVDAQRIELSRLAAVRGRDLADGRPVVDLVSGQRLGPSDRLTAGVAGVVTTVNVPRDGRGIDGPHRLLNQIGIRLAGGEAFVDKVRRR